MSEGDELVVLEFVDETTDEVFETAELPAADWERFEAIAKVQDIPPEEAFRNALERYLDAHSTDA